MRKVTQPLTRMVRFTDGRLLIFDPPHLQEGFNGWCAIYGHVITIRDGGTRNIEGRYRVAFRRWRHCGVPPARAGRIGPVLRRGVGDRGLHPNDVNRR